MILSTHKASFGCPRLAGVAAFVLLVAPVCHGDVQVVQPPRMGFPEAFTRGYVLATCEADDAGRPLMIRLQSFREVETDLAEPYVFLSPHPARPDYWPTSSQDVALRSGWSVPAGLAHDFAYGSYATATDDPFGTFIGVDSWYGGFDPWWCAEERQFTWLHTRYYFGGETTPEPSRGWIEGTDPGLDLWNGAGSTWRQDYLWTNFRRNPHVLVGKVPLWSVLPAGVPGTIRVGITATNTGYEPAQVLVEDAIPAGWGTGADAVPAPIERVTNSDGSVTLRWLAHLAGAIAPQSGLQPTLYDSVSFSYALEVPPQAPQTRRPLPPAAASCPGPVPPGGSCFEPAHSAEPLLQAGPESLEGERVLFDWRGTDASRNSYFWDFDGDGVVDAGGPGVERTYGDDGVPRARVEATWLPDPSVVIPDVLPVTVRNVAPTARILSITLPYTLTIRVAGEKFNLVCLELIEDGLPAGRVCVERHPGSPDRQTATLEGEIDLLRSHAVRVTYDADDPPVNATVNAGTPVWITNREGRRIHHTFVVAKGGPEQVWEPDLADLFPAAGTDLTFTARSTDPGSDDLEMTWDFEGDGVPDVVEVSTSDPSGVPDPDPSYENNPRDVLTRTVHAYPAGGPRRVVFRSRDDDGGASEDGRDLIVP